MRKQLDKSRCEIVYKTSGLDSLKMSLSLSQKIGKGQGTILDEEAVCDPQLDSGIWVGVGNIKDIIGGKFKNRLCIR